MAESLIYKFEKRVIFPPSKQRQFLLSTRKKSKLSWLEFTDKVGAHKRTLNDWRREKYSLPLSVLKKICIITKSKTPTGIEIKDPFWYVSKGAKIGGFAVYKKYGRIGGDPKIRKQKWLRWWKGKGRFNLNKYFIPKEVFIPRKNNQLAEFVGILIGDGGISKRQVTVTLNYKTDKLYSVFVTNLIRSLFRIRPGIYFRKNESVINIVISRKRAVVFCESIGLKIGNKLKQGLDIPEWIKQKKSFKISCIRGLMDTDGCVFNECHLIKGKKYCYPRLSFTSYSEQLCSSVLKVLEELGFSPRIRNSRNVQLESRKDILGYLGLIGTNNQYHRRRSDSFLGGVGSGCPKRS